MVTPFSSKHAKLGTPEDAFNFFQSQLRIRIEMAFGVLVQRWGILWRPMRINLSHVGDMVLLCMALHNICIDARLEFGGHSTTTGWRDYGAPRMDFTEQFVEGRRVETVIPPDQMEKGRRRDMEESSTREKMCARVARQGLKRPGHSALGMSSDRARKAARKPKP